MAHHLACAIGCMAKSVGVECSVRTTLRTANDQELAVACRRLGGWPLMVEIDGLEPMRFVVTLEKIYDLGAGDDDCSSSKLGMAEKFLSCVMRQIARKATPESIIAKLRQLSGSCP